MDKIFENWRRYLEEETQKEMLTEVDVAGAVKGVVKKGAQAAKGAVQQITKTGKELKKGVASAPVDTTTAGKIETLQDLANIVLAAQGKMKIDTGIKAGADAIVNLIPGVSSISSLTGLSFIDVIKKVAGEAPDKKTQTGLDYLNMDDQISAIVDDEVEAQFLTWLEDKLKTIPKEKWAGTSLAALFPGGNMTGMMQNFLKSRFKDRTIAVPGK